MFIYLKKSSNRQISNYDNLKIKELVTVVSDKILICSLSNVSLDKRERPRFFPDSSIQGFLASFESLLAPFFKTSYSIAQVRKIRHWECKP